MQIRKAKSIVIIILFFCLLNRNVFSKKLGDFDDIFKPRQLCVSTNTVYIIDQCYIYCYSLDKMTLEKRMGGKGAGPQEYPVTPQIKVTDDRLLVWTIDRIDIYLFNGKYISKKLNNRMISNLNYFNGYYIGFESPWDIGKDNCSWTTLNIFDSDLNKIKTIYSKQEAQQIKKEPSLTMVTPLKKFIYYKGKIYFTKGDQVGFVIDTLDLHGNSYKFIQRDYEKIKISEEYKNKWIQRFSNNPGIKKITARYKINLKYVFPDYFPAINNFVVTDERIYVRTYKSNNGRIEFVIFNLSGKWLKTVFLPDADKLYDIRNNNYYYLYENEEQESWELHSCKIE